MKQIFILFFKKELSSRAGEPQRSNPTCVVCFLPRLSFFTLQTRSPQKWDPMLAYWKASPCEAEGGDRNGLGAVYQTQAPKNSCSFPFSISPVIM